MTDPVNRPTRSGGISIRGARTHNLKSINLDVPYNRITSICGLSGSGKSTLAFDVLYAEGQRRYVECFSPYVRQFLEQLDKPDVDSIDGIPPAIAVAAQTSNPQSSTTVGNVTEITDFLRALFGKIGEPYCPSCGKRVRRFSPETTVKALKSLPEGSRVMIAFGPSFSSVSSGYESFRQEWLEKGYFRAIANDSVFDLRDETSFSDEEYQAVKFIYTSMVDKPEKSQLDELGLRSASGEGVSGDGSNVGEESLEKKADRRVLMLDPNGDDRSLMRYLNKRDAIIKNLTAPPIFFALDRVTLGKVDDKRLVDSVEKAFDEGASRCWIFVEGNHTLHDSDDPQTGKTAGLSKKIDGKTWTMFGFSRYLRCEECGTDFPEVEPNLFNADCVAGACAVCGGAGRWEAFDMDRVFPNKSLSIQEGAIAPWSNKAYRAQLREFLQYSEQLGVRVNVPFSELTNKEISAIVNGSRQLGYKGLNGFFFSLLDNRYKMHIRVYLNRWLTRPVCPICKGARLRKEALAVKVGGKNIHELSSMAISDLIKTIDSWNLSQNQREIGSYLLKETRARLQYLKEVGLGYLALERPVSTLSSGESRRVKLTTALGSDLVDMLYVLDEPSTGLHPGDSEKLRDAIRNLRDRGNTVVLVDHDETLLNASDKVVELGPGAGQDGGRIVFEGTVEEIKADPDSLTGSYLSGRRLGGGGSRRRELNKGFIELYGASGYNLKNINVSFPLGCLCVVTGVSGAGKSALVQETLYPALCSKLSDDQNAQAQGLPYDKILGVEDVDEAALVDQTPIGRSPRSNPVTYLKIFDDIRNLYAETPEAKARLYNAGYFSFNVDGGRCDSCKGEGFVHTPMQFAPDVYTRCPFCNGTRYRRSVLEVTYRNKNIAETLDMTAREAFGFFRGEAKIQQKLKRMLDVGLDYLRLGQPANKLSGGEAQRLKLASYLSSTRKGPCLFIMDEPTSGLHFADVVKLLDRLNELVEAGNSVIVVEHNMLVIKSADYIIDLGPGAGDAGGTLVAEGSPEEVAKNPNSLTGKYLAQVLAQH
ncbi:MAG: excinuclease ABC subunit UvrA [Thermoguttaceae bacterium]|nr:excinuclease ABC subunit UvrA [Thermoguttaceae bacterium]